MGIVWVLSDTGAYSVLFKWFRAIWRVSTGGAVRPCTIRSGSGAVRGSSVTALVTTADIVRPEGESRGSYVSIVTS